MSLISALKVLSISLALFQTLFLEKSNKLGLLNTDGEKKREHGNLQAHEVSSKRREPVCPEYRNNDELG